MDGPLYYTATGGTVPRSAQDRAADEINLLDSCPWPFVSGTDVSDALTTALASGQNVWMPGGYTYRISKQITVGVAGNANQAQRLRGDGKSTRLLVDAGFDPNASSIILLQGAETNGPVLQDFYIVCAQPTNAATRAGFVPLGTPGAGTGTAGIKYPPAVLFGNGCNRFRIERMRFSGVWDGIHQMTGSASSSGGWWIRDIEISPYNIGLKIERTADFAHIHGWHHWPFDIPIPTRPVMADGNCYAMMFGAGGLPIDGLNIEELNIIQGRIQVNTNGTSLAFSDLSMDTDCVLEVVACQWVQVSNAYFTSTATGPPNGLACLALGGSGNVEVVNLNGWCGGRPWIANTGAHVRLSSGIIAGTVLNVPFATQTAGILAIAGVEIQPYAPSAWTVPVIQILGGIFSITNSFVGTPSAGDAGLISIATDSTGHQVSGLVLNGWSFTPPGTLGDYRTGREFYSAVIHAGGFSAGGGTITTPVAATLHSSGQKTINYFNANVIHWAQGCSPAGTTDDWALLRYDNTGAPQANTFTVSRASGIVRLSDMGNVITSGINTTDMVPATGWRAFGVQVSGGTAAVVDWIATSDTVSVIQLFRRSRGLPTAPTPVQANDVLGEMRFMRLRRHHLGEQLRGRALPGERELDHGKPRCEPVLSDDGGHDAGNRADPDQCRRDVRGGRRLRFGPRRVEHRPVKAYLVVRRDRWIFLYRQPDKLCHGDR